MSGPRTAATGLVAVRSLLVGLLTIATTALAHTAAGGALPAAPGLIVLILATSATAWPVLRRAARPAVPFLAVGATQVALHPAFQALAGPAAHDAPPGHHPVSWLMVAAHLAAGLGAVALVLAVDPAVRRRWAGRVRRRTAPPVLGPGPVPVGHPPPAPGPVRVATDAPRRGPPGPAPAVPAARPVPRGRVRPPLFRSGVLL